MVITIVFSSKKFYQNQWRTCHFSQGDKRGIQHNDGTSAHFSGIVRDYLQQRFYEALGRPRWFYCMVSSCFSLRLDNDLIVPLMYLLIIEIMKFLFYIM